MLLISSSLILTMWPPRDISHSLLLQVYRSTRRQNPQKHTSTTGHHVTTSPYISFSTTTYYRSTGQHVVKTLRNMPVLQVTMWPPHHISYSLLPPTTGLQVNTSSKPSETYQYYRSPCHQLTIYLILYYYRSTGQHVVKTLRSITGQHVTTSLYLLSSSLLLPTTGPQVNTSSKPSEAYQYHRSPCHHLAIYLILYYYLLQVNMSSNPHNHSSNTGHHVTTSPNILISSTTYYRSAGQHVFKTLRRIPLLQVTMSPPRHISHSPLLPNTGQQVNMSSKPA